MKNGLLKENCKRYYKRIISGLLALVMIMGTVSINKLTANAVELSEEHASKNQVTVTPTFQEGNGVRGFYFTTSSDDPLSYATDWSIRYGTAKTIEGGVYIDGTLTTVALIKIAAGRYYVPLSDYGYSAREGMKMVLDGVYFDDEDVVTFKKTHFIYESGVWQWDEESWKADMNQVSVTPSFQEGNGTSGFYFTTSSDDPLAYATDWNVKYSSNNALEGGVYVDGYLLTAVSMVKIAADRYYVALSDSGYTGTEDFTVIVDGVFCDDTNIVTFERTHFIYEDGAWKETSNGRSQTTVTPTFQEGNGVNGFYFTTSSDDPLAYATDWSVSYGTKKRISGGVYVNETLTNTRLVKIAANRYYVPLSDYGCSGTEGMKVVLEGVFFDDEDVVTFKRTHFIYRSGVWQWDEESWKAEMNQVTVKPSFQEGNGTQGFYITTSTDDPLSYSTSWDIRYSKNNAYEGGVYVDGELTSVGLVKIAQNRYYVALSDAGYSGTEGRSVVIDAIFCDDDNFVTFERAEFVYEEAQWNVITDYYYELSEYRTDDGYTYPAKEGYVFGGWYEDVYFTTPLDEGEKTGKAYAKFLDENVLSVKLQMQTGTISTSDSTYLRFITTVDSYNYSEVGFDITINGTTRYIATDTAYSTLYGYTGEDNVAYLPSVFSTDSNYFCVKRMTDIPNNIFDANMIITPRWTTLDGTLVTGVTRTVSVADGIIGGNFAEGVTFEMETESKAFSAVRCALSTVSYSETEIEPLSVLGNSVLKGTINSDGQSTGSTGLNINLGKIYPAGTMIRYWIYIDAETATDFAYPVPTYDTASLATKNCSTGQWVMIEATFENASSTAMIRIDVANTTAKQIDFYIDNMQLVENATYDFAKGVTFEKSGEAKAFSAVRCALSVTSYSESGIVPASELGTVTLKGTINSDGQSTGSTGVNINLGETYPAGTTIRYWIYIDAETVTDFAYPVPTYDTTSLVTSYCSTGQWVMIETTFKNASSTAMIRIDVANTTAKQIDFYIDNMQLEVPTT